MVPDRFVDPRDGTVLVRLVSQGRPESDHVDVLLKGGLTREVLADGGIASSPESSFEGRRWFHWHAEVIAPFGLCWGPSLQFRETDHGGGPPQLFLFRCYCSGRDRDRAFDEMDAWFRAELGDPSASRERRRKNRRWRRWEFRWGRVEVYYEPRDREATVEVVWDLPPVIGRS